MQPQGCIHFISFGKSILLVCIVMCDHQPDIAITDIIAQQIFDRFHCMSIANYFYYRQDFFPG